MRIYAGVGSRKTPPDVLETMKSTAGVLASMGWMLRSGGAKGADSAFAEGAEEKSEIFKAEDATNPAIILAASHHPNWSACSDYAKKLHGRNAMILLGKNLNRPVEFVICWTPEAKITGGTGMTIRLAMSRNIPVFNLASPSAIDEIVAKVVGK